MKNRDISLQIESLYKAQELVAQAVLHMVDAFPEEPMPTENLLYIDDRIEALREMLKTDEPN